MQKRLVGFEHNKKMAAQDKGPRIESSKSCDIIKDMKTDVICYNFGNRIFIILTQFGRPGTMVG